MRILLKNIKLKYSIPLLIVLLIIVTTVFISKFIQQQNKISFRTEQKRIDPLEIKIFGKGDCNTKTNQALDLLKNKVKNHYNSIVKYIGVIECTASQSGIFVWENPPRLQVGKASIDAGTVWYAGGISHEACHSKQYNDYLLENPSVVIVPREVYFGKSAELQCLNVQYNTLQEIGASQETLDYIKNAIDSGYWNVDYSKRWW